MYSYIGKYSRRFNSDQLTKLKYNLLTEFAVYLRDIKNKISKEVNDNKLLFLNMSKFEFISYFRNKYPKYISSYFEESLYTQVYTCYQNRFDSLIKRITFKKRTFKLFNHYKRNVYKVIKEEKKLVHKKGDLKSVDYDTKNTPLSITLTYLSRYGNEYIMDYIKSVYEISDGKKRKFYDNIIYCVNKFGFKRLYNLSLYRRNNIFRKYKDPIEFKSLSFSGKTTYINSVLSYNKNRRSKISSFITINVPFRKGLNIPVKLSTKFHGNLSDYKKKKDKAQYLYTVLFCDKCKEISVILCKDGTRYLPENKTNYIGIDVNVKHNLFALSDNTFYDFDRQLVNEYIKELDKVDKLKKQDKEYKVGKRRLIMFNTLLKKIKQSNQKLISDICKNLLEKHIDHIVMENLDNSFSRSYTKNDEFDLKYNRISHILNIGSLKDEFKHIAVKYDISVSFVRAEYTSQMCIHCGCINSDNRPDLETFECIECGDKMNADIHAAINIKNRVQETVFRDALLNKNPDGSYIPKKMSHDNVCMKIRESIIQIQLAKSGLSNINYN